MVPHHSTCLILAVHEGHLGALHRRRLLYGLGIDAACCSQRLIVRTVGQPCVLETDRVTRFGSATASNVEHRHGTCAVCHVIIQLPENGCPRAVCACSSQGDHFCQSAEVSALCLAIQTRLCHCRYASTCGTLPCLSIVTNATSLHKQGSRCNSHVQRTCAQLDAGDAEDAGTARRHVLIQIAAAAVLAPFVDPVSVLASTVSSGATVRMPGTSAGQ